MRPTEVMQPRATAHVASGIFRIVKITPGSKHEQYLYLSSHMGASLVSRVKFTYAREAAEAWQTYDLALAYLNFIEEHIQSTEGGPTFAVRREERNEIGKVAAAGTATQKR